jgi:PLP dependent protein
LNGESFQERLANVESRIAAACTRSGRTRDDVLLISVTKTFGPDEIREAVGAGLSVFGENRVQEAAQKIPLCPGRIEWHMIGHLQRNKVRFIPGLFRMVHSLDSIRLAEAMNQACEETGARMPVLLEVNVSGEGSKFGLAPADVPSLLERCGRLSMLEVRGLMTIPAFNPDPEKSRPFFRRLRELRDQCKRDTGFDLPELSMGMSGDFDIAIEEGATMIRLGTILFGGRASRRAVEPVLDE